MKTFPALLVVLALGTAVTFAEDKPAEATPPEAKPSAPAAEAAPVAKKARDPEAAFKKLDANKDDAVSAEEFKAGPLGKKDPVKAEAIFKKKDKDANGSLNLQEFKAAAHVKKAA